MGAHRQHDTLMATAKPLAIGLFVFTLIAYLCLTYAFVTDDFSVEYVAQHSNSHLPLIYKITAVWGGHEGSFLLWVLMLSIWTVAVAIFSRGIPLTMVARVLSVLGMVGIGFYLFMLLTSNPFNSMLPFFPVDGRDLNPLLQDFGMIIHPPMLYMGYVGFSVAFAFAISALISGQLDSTWARWSRPWLIILGVFNARHHFRQLVGVLRTWLGWLVVLGPSRKCLLYALVSGHGACAFIGGDRKARGV